MTTFWLHFAAMTTPKSTRQPTSHIAPFGVRMQPELKSRLEAVAASAGRSLNAEIVERLQASLRDPGASAAGERRKLELVAEFAEWCARHKLDPLQAIGMFCAAYDNDHEIGEYPDVEKVSGISSIDARYLTELYGTWVVERPSRFPILADEKSDARHALDLFTMINLIRAEALTRGVRVKVTFEGEPSLDATATCGKP